MPSAGAYGIREELRPQNDGPRRWVATLTVLHRPFPDGTPDGLFDWVELSDRVSAQGLHQALAVIGGEETGKSDVLSMKLPHTIPEFEMWSHTLAKFHPESLQAEKTDAIRELDRIVAAALGLTPGDLELFGTIALTMPS